MKKIIPYIIIIAIFFFIAKVLVQNWQQVSLENLKFNFIFLVYSFIAMVIALFLGAAGWQQSIKCFGEKVSFLQANHVLALSRTGAYIPGKVWAVLGTVYFAKKEGIAGNSVGANVALETVICSLAGILLTGIALAFLPQYHEVIPVTLYFASIPLICLILYPPLFRKIINFGLKILKQKAVNFSISYLYLIMLLFLYSLNWLFQGISFYLLIYSFYPIPISTLPIVVSANVISWIVGMISFFVPAGLGVKEGVLSITLKSCLPISIGITASILFRLWTILGILVFTVIFGRKHIAELKTRNSKREIKI